MPTLHDVTTRASKGSLDPVCVFVGTERLLIERAVDAVRKAVDAMGARPLEAHLRIDRARHLRRQGRAPAAREQLAAAAALAADLGMPAVEARAHAEMER